MDNHRHFSHNQQQVTVYLSMSVVLLILTAYPYLFHNNGSWSVAAFSAQDLSLTHTSIERFDIIQPSDIVTIKSRTVRHAAHDEAYERVSTNLDMPDYAIASSNKTTIKSVQFSSLGRRFKLVLIRPTHLVTQDFNVVMLDARGKATQVPFDRNNVQALNGYLEGQANSSRVSASFMHGNRLMTAQIRSGDDIFIVEPTYLHASSLRYGDDYVGKPKSSNDSDGDEMTPVLNSTMIVYNLRDHDDFKDQLYDANVGHERANLTSLCNAIRPDEQFSSAQDNSMPAQEVATSQDTHVIGIERKRRGIEFLSEQTRDKTRCTLHLVADYLFYKHVGNSDIQTTINYLLALINRVNQIYLPTEWETGDEKYRNIGFTVQNITIHQEYTRVSSDEDKHYNMESEQVWSAREFLDNFSKHSPPRHYCLAYLLTYRHFDTHVLGLAYVASTRFGTVGGICSPTLQRGDAIYKHNTGISTAKSINGERLITRQADLVVAHELGHNLGAEHDADECRPTSSQGGAYLMHPFAVMGFEKNNRFLSPCSRLAIGRVIRRKGPSCFVAVMDHVCGNGIVEDDEECDGGSIGLGHNDPCCDSSCRLTPGSQCSDRDSWCCSKCRIVPAGSLCRPAEKFNCKEASYCDGRSAECRAAPPAQDNTECVGRGLCRSGDCMPFCEAHDLLSCLCNTPADACKLCCKSSTNGTCVPYDTKAPHLQDGVLCYRGVCEKGRCEQPIQDVVERLWDVLEDITLNSFVKFLRDNIILVVLAISIPIWCIFTHYINEFDRRIKQDVMNAIMKSSRYRHAGAPIQSPFLPPLFVGNSDVASNFTNSNSAIDIDSAKANARDTSLTMHPMYSLTTQDDDQVFVPRRDEPIGLRV